jgi:hypothetical protein
MRLFAVVGVLIALLNTGCITHTPLEAIVSANRYVGTYKEPEGGYVDGTLSICADGLYTMHRDVWGHDGTMGRFEESGRWRMVGDLIEFSINRSLPELPAGSACVYGRYILKGKWLRPVTGNPSIHFLMVEPTARSEP